jgi:hypothetical protein
MIVAIALGTIAVCVVATGIFVPLLLMLTLAVLIAVLGVVPLLLVSAFLTRPLLTATLFTELVAPAELTLASAELTGTAKVTAPEMAATTARERGGCTTQCAN